MIFQVPFQYENLIIRIRQENKLKKVSDAEEIIMSVIWSNEEPMALDEIRTKANATCGKDWKPQTVSTFLTRLCKKGFISSARKGRYHFYTPLINRQEYVKVSYDLLISRFYHGNEGKMTSEIKDL